MTQRETATENEREKLPGLALPAVGAGGAAVSVVFLPRGLLA